jgi:hypothetical protein
VLSAVVRCCLALVLVAAAALKLAAPRSSQSALAAFGLRGMRLRWAAWGTIVSLELLLAAGVAAGSAAAAYTAAALLVAFAVVLAVALARGRGGAPCACFGSRSRVSKMAIARNLLLAAAFAAVPSLPGGEPTTDQWLALGLGFALLAVLGLAVAVLALAREVGMLRLQLGPRGALEIPDEGPEIGSRTGVVGRFDPAPDSEFALAVFTSDGCPACRAVEPALTGLAQHPLVALEVFDEHGDAGVWEELEIPGSPFAVALDMDGTVLAKGTFNTPAQLESVLATAERRRSEHPDLAHRRAVHA